MQAIWQYLQYDVASTLMRIVATWYGIWMRTDGATSIKVRPGRAFLWRFFVDFFEIIARVSSPDAIY